MGILLYWGKAEQIHLIDTVNYANPKVPMFRNVQSTAAACFGLINSIAAT